MRILRRLFDSTPAMLRPLWLVAFLLAYVLVTLIGLIAIYRLFGDTRALDLRLLVWLGVSGIGAAIMFGLSRSFVRSESRFRPWILGLATAVGFWIPIVFLKPTAIQSPSDLFALAVVVAITTALAGYLMQSYSRSKSNA